MFTNRNSKKDFVVNGINQLSAEACHVSIATAFFTDSKPIKEMLERGCKVRMIVRLGFPTSPIALKQCLGFDGCLVRYVSDTSFHPKIYIFGENGAIVGSANLTNAALFTNQEVSLKVDPSDDRFDELKTLFEEYWQQAAVLTDDIINKYNAAISTYEKNIFSKFDEINKNIREAVGTISIDNIQRDKRKKSKEEIFSEDYRKSYQETVESFNNLMEIYLKAGPRRTTERELPLRLEIDSFISYVRDNHIPGDSYLDEPLRIGKDQVHFITPFIKEWRESEYKWLDEHIIPYTYPRIKKVFKNSETLINSSDEDLYNALITCHAFENRFRFFKGGAVTQKKVFFEKNDFNEIREILNYLVFGSGDDVNRMATCIFHPDYAIAGFGRSCVQELIGWVGDKNLPVINGRTTKVLRYFGYDVRQIS
ncbi:MAG: phospholipase D-like domain-containing protein [Bacteriovorax sp.]